ncbi:MAG TPA: NAD(+) synthase [Cyclobacteriaceae bacterium]|jgi:NAD+ synthase (glutamine-hydrolysing)
MRKLRVAGGTVNQIPLDWDNNLFNISACIKEARTNKVDLLCLPELCLTGYGCEDLFLSDWVSKKSLRKLVSLLPQTKGIGVVIGLPIRIDKITYNTSCFIYDGQIQGFYAKQNLANDGIYYEHRWFKPWTPGIIHTIKIENQEYPVGEIIFELKGIKLGLEICEDIWVTERPACRYLEKGVDLILNSSASHFSMGKSLERQELVINSSNLFNCAYVYANLLGNESGQIIFDGDIILAQKGNLLAKGKTFGFESYRILSFDFDFDGGSTKNLDKVIQNCNVQFLQGESLALFDYLRKSRSKGFVISMSGGADSALCAVLVYQTIKSAVQELGLAGFLDRIDRQDLQSVKNLPAKNQIPALAEELLILAYQATNNSSTETLNAAKELSANLNCKLLHWNIDKSIEEYTSIVEEKIGKRLNWEEHDVTLQNIQARARSPIIWMIANYKNYLLLVTSNRSEGSVGYATMDGDTSGSLAPIAGVSKKFIREWLEWAEKEFELPSLKTINNLKPTAELRPPDRRQTDEDDLMPYTLLQEIESMAVKRKLSPVEVFQALKGTEKLSEKELADYVIKFFRLLGHSQWKRERFAPSFHIDDYNINPRSWFRFPVLSSSFKDEIKELQDLINKSN